MSNNKFQKNVEAIIFVHKVESILIIDNTFFVHKFIKRLFANLFLIHHASNLVTALQSAKSLIPNLIILNLNPSDGLDGSEFIRSLRSDLNLRQTILLIVSQIKNIDFQLKYFQAGADYFINIPFDESKPLPNIENLHQEVTVCT